MVLWSTLLFVTLMLWCSAAGAYLKNTHTKLELLAVSHATEMTRALRAAGLHKGLDYNEMDLVFADPDEDVPFTRVLNHFFDPTTGLGLTLECPSPIGEVHLDDPATLWALLDANVGVTGTGVSYRSARQYFFDALTAPAPAQRASSLKLTLQSLGHVSHLIQDMAQPQHVRNDPHPPFILQFILNLLGCTTSTGAYEEWVENNLTNLVLDTGYTPPLSKFPEPAFFFGSHGNPALSGSVGIAEFTNRSFLSDGTNCTDYAALIALPGPCRRPGDRDPDPPLLEHRNTDTTLTQLAYAGSLNACLEANASDPLLCSAPIVEFRYTITDFVNGEQGDEISPTGQLVTGGAGQHLQLTSISLLAFDLLDAGATDVPPFKLDMFDYRDQASLLLPRAVGYSAGLLNYFFRGSIDAAVSKSATQPDKSDITITNTSTEDMDASNSGDSFTLYCDDADGTRSPVSGVSWQLVLSAGTSSSQTFTTPPNSNCLVVFRGTLGKEERAVVGTAVSFPSFIAIDFPGAGCTQANGINDAGQIVGLFASDTSCVAQHGFLFSGGTFTQLNVPVTAFSSNALGINATGQIVGSFIEHFTAEHGFLLSGASFTPIDVPGSSFTVANGINNAGQIVGIFDSPPHGFLLSGGSFTRIDISDVPGVNFGTEATGINDAGQIVGFFDDHRLHGHGWLLSGVNAVEIDVPGSTYTDSRGINKAGQIVGSFIDSAGHIHGFLLSGGSFTTIDFPGSNFTEANGINNAGQIVGRFVDNTGRNHGFIYRRGAP